MSPVAFSSRELENLVRVVIATWMGASLAVLLILASSYFDGISPTLGVLGSLASLIALPLAVHTTLSARAPHSAAPVNRDSERSEGDAGDD